MKPKSDRATFTERPFFLLNDDIRQRAIAAIQNAPIDPLRPLQVLIREAPRKRKPDQNALMFAGPLRDISEQAWFDGKQYSVEVLHEWCKRQFLPEEFDAEQCLENYEKWSVDPSGERVLVGTTKNLTVTGFSSYLEQIYSLGAHLGVLFSSKG